MACSVGPPGDCEVLAQALIQARANPHHETLVGSSILENACSSNNANPALLQILLNCGTDVNLSAKSHTRKWRYILRVARVATRFGSQSSLLMELSTFEGVFLVVNGNHLVSCK